MELEAKKHGICGPSIEKINIKDYVVFWLRITNFQKFDYSDYYIGKIHNRGHEMSTDPGHQGHVSVVFQKYIFFVSIYVLEVTAYGRFPQTFSQILHKHTFLQ